MSDTPTQDRWRKKDALAVLAEIGWPKWLGGGLAYEEEQDSYFDSRDPCCYYMHHVAHALLERHLTNKLKEWAKENGTEFMVKYQKDHVYIEIWGIFAETFCDLSDALIAAGTAVFVEKK